MNILETQEQLRDAKHVEGLQFKCGDCQQIKPVQTTLGTGYGFMPGSNRPVCYECCGKRDMEQMVKEGKAALYLSRNTTFLNPFHELSNWPGTLKLPVRHMRKGRHNIARVRYDVYFTGPDKRQWRGTQYGDNTQICHCKRLKA